MRRNLWPAVAMSGILAGTCSAGGQEPGPWWTTSPIQFSGGVGVVRLRADEYVYVEPGSSVLLSRLIWDSTAPVATGAVEVELPQGWTLTARAQAALRGDSPMKDFDWIGPFVTGHGQGDWTHRSLHPDTSLEWYFEGAVLIGHDLPVTEALTVNLNGGFQYADVQWTAYGGTFVYSTDGFRDDVGRFPAGERGITYRQMFPAVIAGADAEVVDGAWTFGVSGHVGVTVQAVADDHHWERELDFVDDIEPAPLVKLDLSAAYEMQPGLQLYLSGGLEQIFTGRADTAMFYIPTGEQVEFNPDMDGNALVTATLTAGLRGTF